MWHNMGVHGNAKHVRRKVTHPCDNKSFLRFISDFPHLVKCVRNIMIKHGFNTHKGRVLWEHVATTWKVDSSPFTLKVAPKFTRSHIYPSRFEKMRVNLAFYFFSSVLEHAMDFHKERIEQQYPNLEPTKVFINMMAQTIDAMTSRFPAEALRRGSTKETALDNMLEFLDPWEAHAGGLGFLSKSTAEGLRVTIHSAKDLLKYLTEMVGFRFLMTSRLSQDCLERSFGIVRQASGANDHPTPAQFIIIIKCISFCSLAKSPKGANVSSGLLEALLSENHLLSENEAPACDDITLPVEAAEVVIDHADYVEEHSDDRLTYYIAGYVARKRIFSTHCEACKDACLVTRDSVSAPNCAASSGSRKGSPGRLLPLGKAEELSKRGSPLPSKIVILSLFDALGQETRSLKVATRKFTFTAPFRRSSVVSTAAFSTTRFTSSSELSSRVLPAKLTFPLVCTVSTSYRQSTALPSDGVCDYLFYDSLYKGNANAFTEPLGPDVNDFVQRAGQHRTTEFGLSFASDNSRFVRDYDTPAFEAKVADVANRGVSHLGILNMLNDTTDNATFEQALRILLKFEQYTASTATAARYPITALGVSVDVPKVFDWYRERLNTEKLKAMLAALRSCFDEPRVVTALQSSADGPSDGADEVLELHISVALWTTIYLPHLIVALSHFSYRDADRADCQIMPPTISRYPNHAKLLYGHTLCH
ncbi:uncharacterized protein LOC119403406 [Rhipicephalus sanguineus]|uniref:uncharacterized protein LOC119403406 n=1 Tax=Rhipicephalus sanguineus TaxID=34632 RepID=UPI001893CFD4|nr:uncharacterized protein LOC119403406 [Rhipicephalus sanguineus]